MELWKSGRAGPFEVLDPESQAVRFSMLGVGISRLPFPRPLTVEAQDLPGAAGFGDPVGRPIAVLGHR